jgi:hypothetical protein
VYGIVLRVGRDRQIMQKMRKYILKGNILDKPINLYLIALTICMVVLVVLSSISTVQNALL